MHIFKIQRTWRIDQDLKSIEEQAYIEIQQQDIETLRGKLEAGYSEIFKQKIEVYFGINYEQAVREEDT